MDEQPAATPALDTRLRRLLDALLLVETETDTTGMLRRLVEVACVLLDARYGALGIVGDDGRLQDFIFVGVEPDGVERIGHLPLGRGLIGHVISHPRPLRLRDLSAHPASHGFPPEHPEMRSFLGVPLRGRYGVVGDFYLTEKQGAEEFSEDDEGLAVALADWAGVVVENARLNDATRRREQWLEALHDVTSSLLAGADSTEVLERLACHARDLVRADTATIVQTVSAEKLEVRVAEGAAGDRLRGAQFPVEGSISGEVVTTGNPMRLDDLASDARTQQPLVAVAGFGPGLFVPLASRSRRFGTIGVARLSGGVPFTDHDLRLVASFAGQAALVLEYGRAQQEIARIALLEDRERIARDLHDSVIQRLFATGMALQGATRLAESDDLVGRLQQAVDDLDITMRDIRSTIFAIHHAGRQGRGLRSEVLALAGEAAGSLGFEPHVRFTGPIDSGIPDDVAEDILATLREALSNVARHAAASKVEVRVSVGADIALEVVDDGHGATDRSRAGGLGLANMASRAQARGGSFELTASPAGGSTVTWRVPGGGSAPAP